MKFFNNATTIVKSCRATVRRDQEQPYLSTVYCERMHTHRFVSFLNFLFFFNFMAVHAHTYTNLSLLALQKFLLSLSFGVFFSKINEKFGAGRFAIFHNSYHFVCNFLIINQNKSLVGYCEHFEMVFVPVLRYANMHIVRFVIK